MECCDPLQRHKISYTYRTHAKSQFRRITKTTAKETHGILCAGDYVCVGCFSLIRRKPQLLQEQRQRLAEGTDDSSAPSSSSDEASDDREQQEGIPSAALDADVTLSKVLPLLDTAPLRKRKYAIINTAMITNFIIHCC